jgi:diguanylate cyclase (GGDEF)-like protein
MISSPARGSRATRNSPAARENQPPRPDLDKRAAAATRVRRRPAVPKLSRSRLELLVGELTEENERLRQQVRAQRSLWQIAHQDPLTGLWNRRYADGRLAQELSRAKRETQYRFSIVLIDVDNLKRINDQTGHPGGDRALRWVASFLKEGLRGHDLCCRIGGDEFLLILPASGEQECHDLVLRLRRRWQASAESDLSAVPISIGTASFPVQGSTVDELFGLADRTMYDDKRRNDRRRQSGTSVAGGRPARAEEPQQKERGKPKASAVSSATGGPRTRLASV